MPKVNFKFSLGDTVRVTNYNHAYPVAAAYFRSMGFKNLNFNDLSENGGEGKIFGTDILYGEPVYAVRFTNSDKEVLIHENGLERTNNFKFQGDDLVIVTNNNKTYTTYSDMFIKKAHAEKMGFKNTDKNSIFPNGTVARVFALSRHLDQPDRKLYALVDMNGNETLIREEGLTFVSKVYDKNLFKRDLFINVRLNEEYIAEVYNNKIVVGCQTITKESFVELVDAAKRKGLID